MSGPFVILKDTSLIFIWLGFVEQVVCRNNFTKNIQQIFKTRLLSS